MKTAVTGATGLVGSAVVADLEARGHSVLRITRRAQPGAEDQVEWDPQRGTINTALLAGVEAIVHLAGEPIEGRWTREKKERILGSRVNGTQLIARTAASMSPRPRVLICASAYAYYGDRGNEVLTEASPPGTGFLAEVAQAWEASAQPARDAGIRVIHTRFGFVLSARGGVLGRLKWLWRCGLGATFGSGRQWWPWTAVQDVAGVVRFAFENEHIAGPVNVVAPQQVTNAEFARALARAVSRPMFMRVPAWAIRLFLGESGDALVLGSYRIAPQKLQQAGYKWALPDLETAFRRQLGSPTED